MALYAFDGTWNDDEADSSEDTNVVRFCELYADSEIEYKKGVGTKFGLVGKLMGGLLGAGGRSRIAEMSRDLAENWRNGDKDIDIIGFSRGAALAVHFANKIAKHGIKGTDEEATIRFLGLWDLVGSFGLSLDTIINFQSINIGWNIDEVPQCVEHCYHAMAMDERRETFNVTRLDPENTLERIQEVWFRGVHADVGGGNKNVARSNIALNWMLDNARATGIAIDEDAARDPRYSEVQLDAPISKNKDLIKDPGRTIGINDLIHPSATHGDPAGPDPA